MTDAMPLFKKVSPLDKANCRLISLLWSLSNDRYHYQRKDSTLATELIFGKKLSTFLCGFCSRYGMQHAFLNSVNKWQGCMDNLEW